MLCELWEDGLSQLYVARSATCCQILWLYCGLRCVQNLYASSRSSTWGLVKVLNFLWLFLKRFSCPFVVATKLPMQSGNPGQIKTFLTWLVFFPDESIFMQSQGSWSSHVILTPCPCLLNLFSAASLAKALPSHSSQQCCILTFCLALPWFMGIHSNCKESKHLKVP